jgi:hypothetical protein
MNHLRENSIYKAFIVINSMANPVDTCLFHHGFPAWKKNNPVQNVKNATNRLKYSEDIESKANVSKS